MRKFGTTSFKMSKPETYMKEPTDQKLDETIKKDTSITGYI